MTATSFVAGVGLVLVIVGICLLLGVAFAVAVALLLGIGWLGWHAYPFARRALEVAVATVRDVREPSGRHRRIGEQPAVARIPLCDADTAELVVINPDSSPRKAA